MARRRQLLVFDRFLARIGAVLGDAATLKGGLALECRIERARTTKDVDLRMMGSPYNILAQLQEAGAPRLRRLHELRGGSRRGPPRDSDRRHAIYRRSASAPRASSRGSSTDSALAWMSPSGIQSSATPRSSWLRMSSPSRASHLRFSGSTRLRRTSRKSSTRTRCQRSRPKLTREGST